MLDNLTLSLQLDVGETLQEVMVGQGSTEALEDINIMSLPYFQSTDRNMSMLQTQWASQLNPLLSNPLFQGNLIRNVALINGTTIVNHRLGRALVGWFLVDINGAATIYSSSHDALTLSLISNAAVNVSLYVF